MMIHFIYVRKYRDRPCNCKDFFMWFKTMQKLQSYNILTGKWHTWIRVLNHSTDKLSHLYVAVVVIFFFFRTILQLFWKILIMIIFRKKCELYVAEKGNIPHTKERFCGLCSDFTGSDFLIIFPLRELLTKRSLLNISAFKKHKR